MTRKIVHPRDGVIPLCPKCGNPLVHHRFLNEEIFGGGEDNPFIGWVCMNEKCKGWYCEGCQEWHPYGTICIDPGDYTFREDPNWKHKERDLEHDKFNNS